MPQTTEVIEDQDTPIFDALAAEVGFEWPEPRTEQDA